MATDLERMVVSLEANIAKYEASLAKAMSGTNTQAGKIEKRFDAMSKKLEKSFDFSGFAARGLATLGVGLSAGASIKAVTDAAQQFTALQNALKVTGLEGASLEQTLSSLFQIAQKNGTEIAPLTTLYSRAAQAQNELNASSADLLKFTDGVSVALRVAGSSSAQASGALLQLSQAIGGGVVRAEEFNSVNEGARPILQAVAAGLNEAGGSVSKLKTLVNDGKVSSEAFFRAFLAGMPQLEAQAARADQTVSQATARISNAFILLVGNLDKTTGASSNAAKNLSALGEVLEGLPGYFDAAAKKLDEFQSYLTQLGNSPVWEKIAKFMGEDLSNIPRGPGGESLDISIVLERKKLASITSELVSEEARLAEIRSRPLSDTDNIMLRQVEGRISALRTERDLLQRRVAPTSEPNVGPGGRVAEGSRDQSGQALAPAAVKPVSLKDFKVPGASNGDAQSDAFERSTAQIEKRIALLNSESATIDLGVAARERARVVIELETAARKANEAAGLTNTEVTEAQRAKIDELADAYARSRAAVENANGPLLSFARSARDINAQLQDAALGGLHSFEDALIGVLTGTESVADAFKSMANSIIADIARIAIRQAITGPISQALGGLFGGGGGGSVGTMQIGSQLFPQYASGTNFAPGGAAIVGEKGPEIVNLPRGAQVIPNNISRQIGGGVSVPVNISIDARGADNAVEARINAQVAQLRAELPSIVVSSVKQAQKGRSL